MNLNIADAGTSILVKKHELAPSRRRTLNECQ